MFNEKTTTMKYIKSLLAMMLVALTFSACNELEDMDADSAKATYPAGIGYGYYVMDNSSDTDYNYGIVVAKGEIADEEGNVVNDTVLHVIMTGKEGTKEAGLVRTIGVCHGAYYDQKLGILQGTCDYSFYEDILTGALAYDRFGNLKMQVNHAFEGEANTIAYSSAKKVDELPSFYATWEGVIGEQEFSLYAHQGKVMLDENEEEMLDENGNPIMTYGTLTIGETVEEILPLSVEGNLATATGAETGTVVTLSYNAEMQVEATINGNKAICERVINEPEPEVYLPYATGIYAHGVKNVSVKAMGGEVLPALYPQYIQESQYEVTLLRGQNRSSRFLIYPYAAAVGDAGLYFELGEELEGEENEGSYYVIAEPQQTFLNSQNGPLFIMDADTGWPMFGVSGEDHHSIFNTKTNIIEFYFVITDFDGLYGVDCDNLIILGSASTSKKAPKKIIATQRQAKNLEGYMKVIK